MSQRALKFIRCSAPGSSDPSILQLGPHTVDLLDEDGREVEVLGRAALPVDVLVHVPDVLGVEIDHR